MKNFRRHVPIVILIVIIFIEVINLYTHKPRTELVQIKTSVASLIKFRWNEFIYPRDSIDAKVMAFSKLIENDLPAGSKILYVKDTSDGTDMRRYFILNYLLKGRADAVYNFEDKPSIYFRGDLMKKTNSDLSISYEMIYDGHNKVTSIDGKLYQIGEDDQIKVAKEYRL